MNQRVCDKRYCYCNSVTIKNTKNVQSETQSILFKSFRKKNQNKTKYNETHREEKRERDNEYRENNRDILHATKLELIICECQSVRSSIDRHRKSESKKHIELMNRNKTKHTNKKNMNHNRKKNK